MPESNPQIKNIIFTVIIMILGARSAQAIPVCNFFTQGEIVQAYTKTEGRPSEYIYLVNTEMGKFGTYHTVIFNAECHVLYRRELDGIPLAIFNLSDASDVVFITEATGSAYRVNAYLVEKGVVKPLITNMGSKIYPEFRFHRSSSTPDIIVCINDCGIFRFDDKIKRYHLQGYRACSTCLPRGSPSEQSSAWYPLVRSDAAKSSSQ